VDAALADSGDGLTWSTAYTTIQAGIYSAGSAVTAVGGPEYCHVWVKAGTYAPTEGSGDNATVLLVDGVRVYGGFSDTALLWADRDPAGNLTTVDGAGVYHVVTGADGAVINGFVITGGNTQSAGGGIDGAGMYNLDASPRVEECTFNDNYSESDGGGMYNAGAAAPVIVGCTFTGNTAESNGAAIANTGTSAPTIEDCLFEDNEAASGMGTGNGGAISGSTSAVVAISRCTFRNNLAVEHGGAIYFNAATGSVSVVDSTFEGNALQFGGGANDGGAVYVSGSTATIERCVLSGSGAPNGGRGGGLYAANSITTVVNTAFLQNTVGSGTGGNYGGAIYATGGTMTITNCTLYGNAATTSAENLGGGIYLSSSANVDSQNTIIWGNTPQGIYVVAGGSCSNVYSDLQDGAGNPDYNNISEDPVFVGGSPYDLHLQGTSPCIDEGTAAGAPAVDLDGDPRPTGDGYDMGAYEF
ncbi:MAG: right-handed parallel beta-helix repeat-containing protein, partial [Proteobacteria bacterium]|jgi:predicted outer membrane repeat protein|nr:right-handed parallel beta-helix repeat-containing protein [Pseudomonadota bacterium]